jgi:2,3-bisphosphoglycerate-independent phosphoglycerate mutase
MMNEDGSPNTAHSTNLVPCILVDKNFKPELRDGKLGDVSPTILKMMGVAQPKEMTGVALF